MFDSTSLDAGPSLGDLRRGLLRFALKLTTNPSDAEDLVHDALARAYEQQGRFYENTNLRAWLCVVVRNLAIDEARRMGKPSRRSFDEAICPQFPSEPESAWEYLSTDDIVRSLRECPGKLRHVFEMHYFEGMKLHEIADQLNLPVGTVATRLHRTREKLRRLLEPPAANAPG